MAGYLARSLAYASMFGPWSIKWLIWKCGLGEELKIAIYPVGRFWT